jgi:hypothetical protein
VVLAGVLVFLLTADLAAYPGRSLNLQKVVNAADVVAVVEITDIRSLGTTGVVVDDNAVEAISDEASIRLVRRIKGSCPKQLTIQYYTTIEYVGLPGIDPGFQVVFLKRDSLHYEFADRHFPSVPARDSATSALQPEPNPEQAVIDELGSILASPDEPLEKKWKVMALGYSTQGYQSFVPYLRSGLTATTSPDLQFRIQLTLSARNDVSALSALTDSLVKGTLTEKEEEDFLGVVANNLKDSRTLPSVLRLARSEDTSTRRSAAQALWHIADRSALPTLESLLSDQDQMVRFYAVRALSTITQQNAWGPSSGAYEIEESTYLQHWLDWSKSQPQ